jgi:hypothetical protein
VNDAFAEYPVIGKRSPEEQAEILRELGDDETADALMASRPAATTKSIFGGGAGMPWSPKPWSHTSHSFGFLPQAGPADPPLLPLYHAGQIKADLSLRGACVTIRLDRLRVADYPGGGVHRVLFDFAAVNAIGPAQTEHLHYNATFRAREGEEAAVVGLPIFASAAIRSNRCRQPAQNAAPTSSASRATTGRSSPTCRSWRGISPGSRRYWRRPITG